MTMKKFRLFTSRLLVGSFLLFSMLVTSLSVATISLESVYAADPAGGSCSNNTKLLNVIPVWYRGLCGSGKIELERNNLAKTFAIIALNCADIIVSVAGIVAIGAIIWSGFMYILAKGDVGKIAAAKTALSQAIIGLIVAVSASSIASIAVGVMGDDGSTTGLPSGEISDVLAKILEAVYKIGGLLAVCMIIFSSFQYYGANGDPGKVATATKTIIYSLVGLAVMIAAYAITSYVLNKI